MFESVYTLDMVVFKKVGSHSDLVVYFLCFVFFVNFIESVFPVFYSLGYEGSPARRGQPTQQPRARASLTPAPDPGTTHTPGIRCWASRITENFNHNLFVFCFTIFRFFIPLFILYFSAFEPFIFFTTILQFIMLMFL